MTKPKDDGRPAFPHHIAGCSNSGMTLRQYAAIKMAAGLVSDQEWTAVGGWIHEVVGVAVKLADALISELDKEER